MTYQNSYSNLGSSPLSAPQSNRVRRASMELNQSQLYQHMGGLGSSFKQDSLGLLLGQDPGSLAANGLLDPTGAPSCEPLTMAGLNGLEGLPIDAEEPGPLPCLPRMNRMGNPYGNHSSMLMQQQQQQQLQRCGYPPTGAPGPGGRNRPRRHSVTIGMLNENQQALLAAAASGQLSSGWGQPPTPAGPSQMSMMPQQSPQNKQLPGIGMHGTLQQSGSGQLGMRKPGLGQPFGGLPMPQQQQQQQQQFGGPGPASLGGSSSLGSNGNLAGMDFPPAYSLNAPRMPGAGSSRRHSWAPMGAESSMAYARQCLLLQQQQQRNSSIAAQLGDAGALFVNQQQQDQLGLGGLGGLAGLAPLPNGLGASLAGLGNNGMLGTDGELSSGSNAISLGQPTPQLPLYGDLAKEQLAQHLQQQLQQLQLQQQQQGLRNRLQASGRALDPYAEPFISQANNLAPAGVGGLGNNLGGPDPYTAALQQELLQQQQRTALAGLQFDEQSLNAAAAAGMYAPLQVNGVSVDTQLLVSPYVDNWDLLGQSANNSLSNGAGSLSAGNNGLTSIGSLNIQAALQSMGSMGNVGISSKPKGGPARSNSIGSTSFASHSSAGPAAATTNGKGGATGQGTAAAAAAAAASMVASLPPLSKVCSDEPWDLKKAAEEDAQLFALQQAQVRKLAAALERSKTLQQAQAAAAAQAADAPKAAGTGADGKSAAADTAHTLFGYQLPDSGNDTWGGASVPDVVPGGNCISKEPSNKLFVGNIGWWVTEDDLLHWFSRFGTVVNVKIMYNSRKMHKPKDKWRSREYGFIDYASPEEAAKAIVWMDGVELPDLVKDTCGIIVQYAKPTSTQEGASGNAA